MVHPFNPNFSPKINLLKPIPATADPPFYSVADNARAATRFHRRRHHSRKPDMLFYFFFSLKKNLDLILFNQGR
ncbi:hypothetical protein ES288_A06G191900v1 [Gossypium darwinii]|uniref:Uncharacterized protein n=1 Tax=Gossypium darwinii TaxID=34276 RepID=A0A5D2G7F8_GOSDA|nr:hypothetical protein ES288_A06G191900v1 [Gossypium darwinii]